MKANLQSDDDYTTDSEEIHRLKVDAIYKIKHRENKNLKPKCKKLRKLDALQIENFDKIKKFTNNDIKKCLSFRENEKDLLTEICVEDEIYNWENKPECGTLILFQLDNDRNIHINKSIHKSHQYLEISSKKPKPNVFKNAKQIKEKTDLNLTKVKKLIRKKKIRRKKNFCGKHSTTIIELKKL